MISITLFTIISSLLVGATSTNNAPINFSKTYFETYGHTQVLEGGNLVTVMLDQRNESSFSSKFEILHGKVDIQIKLAPGESLGTVTEFYIGSKWPIKGYQIGFKFLGNKQGQPYTLQTSIRYSHGKGYATTQNLRLWFDPTKDFNTYSILWNKNHILYYVNGVPIRIIGATEFKDRPMMILGKMLWQIGTREGWVKTDWSKAPFISSLRNIRLEKVCFWTGSKSTCDGDPSSQSWLNERLDTPATLAVIKGVQFSRGIH